MIKPPSRYKKTDKSKFSKNSVVIDIDNPELLSAFDLLTNTNQSVFITGKAGTGKSTFLRHLVSTTAKKHVVLAPTGIAAVNVGGQTLHSFFKIPLKPLLPDDPDFAVTRLRQRLKFSRQHIILIRSLELIIIDEISMVRADVIDFIDRVLRVYTGRMRLPFGGIQLLFVGDVFQLEPVVTGNDRDVLSHAYSSFFFFNAKVFNELKLIPIELTKVYRQNDEDFIRILDNIRMGINLSQSDIATLNSRVKTTACTPESEENEFTMTIATRREMVDSINERHLNALPTPTIEFNGVIEGDFPLNALPTDLKLELKVGAQIVFVKNDPEKRWVNGTIAVIKKCLPYLITVETEDGEEHEVQMERWTNVKYVYDEKTKKVDEIELGSFIQFPLKLAWALTIHKSQGLTFKKVIIDLGYGAFTGGQTYVALSRSRSLDGITLMKKVTQRDIYVNPLISKFASKFNNRGLIDYAIASTKGSLLYLSANTALESGNYIQALKDYFQASLLNPQVLNTPAVQRLIGMKLLKFKQLASQINTLKESLEDAQKKLAEIAMNYVKAADELSGDGWETEAALAQYEKALEIYPGCSGAMLGKARILTKTGNFDDAFSLYDTLSKMQNKDAWRGDIGKGEIAGSTGDDFEAISNFMAAHEKAPFQSIPLEKLIEKYHQLRDFDSANFYKNKLSKIKRRKPDT